MIEPLPAPCAGRLHRVHTQAGVWDVTAAACVDRDMSPVMAKYRDAASTAMCCARGMSDAQRP